MSPVIAKQAQEVPKKRKKRRQNRKRRQKEADDDNQFDSIAWFKSYFDNFFQKEQRLKKLTEMDDFGAMQSQLNRERTTSQMR